MTPRCYATEQDDEVGLTEAINDYATQFGRRFWCFERFI